MSEPLRLGVLGLADHEDALLAAVLADRRIALARPAVGDAGPELMWLRGDAVDHDTAAGLLDSGQNVLVGSPAELTPAEWDALADVARGRGTRVGAVHRRASPPFAKAAALAAAGRLGLPRMLQIHLVEVPSGDGHAGLLFEGVDAARGVLGLEPVSVYATRDPGDRPGARIAVVEFERGVPVTLVVGRTAAADPVGGGLRRIVAIGSQGMLALEEDRPRLEVHAAPRSADAAARAADGGALAARAAAMAGELMEIARDGAEPTCGALAARIACAVVETAERAAQDRAATPVAG